MQITGDSCRLSEPKEDAILFRTPPKRQLLLNEKKETHIAPQIMLPIPSTVFNNAMTPN
jgi:hypothetical protein